MLSSIKSHWKIGLVILLVLGTITGIIIFIHALFTTNLPSNSLNVLYDKQGISFNGDPGLTYGEYSQIPGEFVNMILDVEDKNFWRHSGIDFLAIFRALFANIQAGKVVQGASTIEQQLIKINDRAYKRTRFQKIKEQFGALALNSKYTKKEILLSYLNQLPFPYGTQGVLGGCMLYFGKNCNQLTPSEQYFVFASAQLGDNGFTSSGFRSIKNQSEILCNYVQLNHRGDDLNAPSCENRVTLSPTDTSELIGFTEMNAIHAKQFFDSMSDVDRDRLGVSLVDNNQGLQTSYNLEVHNRIQRIIENNNSLRKQVGAKDCCVVLLDKYGNLESMNVCRDRDDPVAGTVNGCLMKRQTGSAVKPFLYLFAMKQLGLSPTSTIEDEEVTFELGNGGLYKPKNFDLRYHGTVTIAQALASSLNIPAVKLLHQGGIQDYATFFSLLRTTVGHDPKQVREDFIAFSPENQGLSLALGTYEMSPLRFAQLRRIFASQETMQKDLETTASTKSKHLSPQNIYVTRQNQIKQIRDILSQPKNALLSFDNPSHHLFQGRATKTGTSRNFIDGWTCGLQLQSNIILCVRMGNYEGNPMKDAGSKTAGVLWRIIAEEL